MLDARSTYPSEERCEKRPSMAQWPPSRPDESATSCLAVLKEPYDSEARPENFDAIGADVIFNDAPNAPVPAVEVPTPRCNCTEPSDDTKSGVSYQYTEWVSASFIGTPLRVTLMRVGSVPRTRNEVEPIPVPLSDEITTEGRFLSNEGMSSP